jgi:hypothetical protein
VPRVAEARHCSLFCEIGKALQGGASIHYELTAVAHVDDAPHGADVADLILVGARVHPFLGQSDNIQYHFGFDLAWGAALGGARGRGGFAYDMTLYPIGVAVRFDSTGFVALGTGIGFMGATGSLDDAVLLPFEANLEVDLTKRLRLLARARASYEVGAPGRHDGAPSAPFADELEGMLGVRIGHHYMDNGFPSGNGYFVGLATREFERTTYLGLTFGYEVDISSPEAQRQKIHRRREGHPLPEDSNLIAP